MASSSKIFTTNTCQKFGHSEFRLVFDSPQVIDPDVIWLVEFLTRNIASGTQYKPGELVQIGWMVLKIQTNEEGTLSLLEPDFLEIPIRFTDSVTQTLVQLRLQKSVAESIDFEDLIAFPSLQQSCLICARIKDRGDFMMERFEPSQNDSGWYLGCIEQDHNHNDPINLQRVSLYDIACGILTCVPFLALPPKTVVETRAGNYQLRYKGQVIVPKENSFLQRYLLLSSRKASST